MWNIKTLYLTSYFFYQTVYLFSYSLSKFKMHVPMLYEVCSDLKNIKHLNRCALQTNYWSISWRDKQI